MYINGIDAVKAKPGKTAFSWGGLDPQNIWYLFYVNMS